MLVKWIRIAEYTHIVHGPSPVVFVLPYINQFVTTPRHIPTNQKVYNRKRERWMSHTHTQPLMIISKINYFSRITRCDAQDNEQKKRPINYSLICIYHRKKIRIYIYIYNSPFLYIYPFKIAAVLHADFICLCRQMREYIHFYSV